jgi:hypothetical protein
MSGRVKIKSKVVKATLGNKDVLDMFHGVLGTSEGGATLTVTHPKYLNIQTQVGRFLRLLGVFRDSALMKRFPGPAEHLRVYTEALQAQFAASFTAPNLEPFLRPALPVGPDGKVPVEAAMMAAEDYSKIPPETVSQFNDVFAAVKKCSLVNTVIVTCNNLISHKKSLQDANALRDRFLTKDAGMIFCPLPDLAQVNFKQIYIDDRLAAEDRLYILTVLHKLYMISHDTYEAVSAPDVDVDEFVQVIMSSIGEVKKHIPRCDEAFDKIMSSVGLLKNNFGGYYKDYVGSGNPTIIMENFVMDVSKNTKASVKVTAQFRKIISHYKKLAAQQATNPKMKSLFQQVDANFLELDRKNREADERESDSDSDGDGEGAADSAAPTKAADSAAADSAAPAKAADSAAPAKAAGAKTSKRAATRRRRRMAARNAVATPEVDAGGQESLFDELDQRSGEPDQRGDDEAARDEHPSGP